MIETIVYIALFSIIMSGCVVSIYSIMSGNARNVTKAMVLQEGNFLIHKIEWVLKDTKSITVSSDGAQLFITKHDSSTMNFLISSGDISIQTGNTARQTLNNSNVDISCPPSQCFSYSTDLKNLSISLTLSSLTSEGLLYSQTFQSIKFFENY